MCEENGIPRPDVRTFTPEEADDLGAFEEDALDEEEAVAAAG